MHTESKLHKDSVERKLFCAERLERARALKDAGAAARSSRTLSIPFFALGINLALLDLIYVFNFRHLPCKCEGTFKKRNQNSCANIRYWKIKCFLINIELNEGKGGADRRGRS